MLTGSDSFVQSLRSMLRDVEENRKFCREERLATRPTLEGLFVDTANKATRNERIHNAVREHQYRLKEVGDYLALCYSTIGTIDRGVDENNES